MGSTLIPDLCILFPTEDNLALILWLYMNERGTVIWFWSGHNNRKSLQIIMNCSYTDDVITYILDIFLFRLLLLMLFPFWQLAGLLWRLNFLMVQNLIQVPRVVANTFDQLLGRFLDSTDSQVSLLPMGATLEIQQGERLDKLEQQMLAAAMQASRRMEISRPQPLVMFCL